MALFIRDNKRQVLQYLPSWENGGQSGFVDLHGHFTDAADVKRDNVIDYFHANDFEEIETYLAAKDILDNMLDVTLERGIITPDGGYYGLRKGVREEQFVAALKIIQHRLPENLEKQVHGHGIGAPWLSVRKGFGTSIPSDSSKAQIETLQTIGYKNGDQIYSNGKFYNEAFPLKDVRGYPVPDNPAFSALVDTCFDLWDEWDKFRKEHRAAYVSICSIDID